MSARAPRIKVPPSGWRWIFGQVEGQTGTGPDPLTDPLIKEYAEALAAIGTKLIPHAKTLADAFTPLAGRHALVMFRPALDALAAYLTRWFGFNDTAEIVPPCSFRIEFQSIIMRLAETTQALQDWDTGQSFEGVPTPLPSGLVTTLESAVSDLAQLQIIPDAPLILGDECDAQFEGEHPFLFRLGNWDLGVAGEASYRGMKFPISGQKRRLLVCLVKAKGKPVTIDRLIAGCQSAAEPAYFASNISRLKNHLGKHLRQETGPVEDAISYCDPASYKLNWL
jgi:hypothetical protein